MRKTTIIEKNEGDEVEIQQSVEIAKLDPERQQVFGWAYVAQDSEGKQVIDKSGEFVDDVEALEDAAYQFVLDFREAGDMHVGTAKGDLIESIVVTRDKLQKMAPQADPTTFPALGWWVGFHLNDRELFEKVKTGERPMFSVQGKAIKEKVEV